MAERRAEALAGDILEGTYVPTLLENCEPELARDRNGHAVLFAQFVLFARPPGPDVRAPEYAILQPQMLFKGEQPVSTDSTFLRSFANGLMRNLPVERLPGPESNIDEIREAIRDSSPTAISSDLARASAASLLMSRSGFFDRRSEEALPASVGPPPPPLDLPDTELRVEYREWVEDLRHQSVLSRLEPLVMANLVRPLELEPNFSRSVEDLIKGLGDFLFPTPSAPFASPYPHLALCATYEQLWEPKGYTRGELINSISLAPGEQLTLEIHSWDKSTMKSEEELSATSEFRATEKITQRDTLTVVQEMSRQKNTHLNANATVPVGEVPVQLGANVTVDTLNKLTQTEEGLREDIVEASQTLTMSRKLRIEIAREVGREEKQTHVVSNTNRCHSLNCHYFEVTANYLVTTRLESVRPCLLLPNPKLGRVTPDWILCYEDVLKQALLDKTFLAGFEGSRTLETHDVVRELEKEEWKPQPAQPGGLVDDALQEELRKHWEAILHCYDELLSAVSKVKSAAGSTTCAYAGAGGVMAFAVCVAVKAGITALRRALYLAVLTNAARSALNRLKDDAKEGAKPNEALRSLFASVTSRDFRLNAVSAAAAKALEALGLPGDVVDALLDWGLLELAVDDAGLYNAAKAAAAKLEEPSKQPGAEGTMLVKPTAPETDSKTDLAAAQVAYEQLKCHIEDNWLHYYQSIWLRENGDQRFLRLQGFGAVATILANEVLGFLAHKTGYPITDLSEVKRWIDFETVTKEISEVVEQRAPEPVLVTLPTLGTVLEAMIGECDACEDFIRQSRLLDLRTQTAKTVQEEAEARRREMRLSSIPPDLDDPSPAPTGQLVVRIEKPEDDSSGGG